MVTAIPVLMGKMAVLVAVELVAVIKVLVHRGREITEALDNQAVMFKAILVAVAVAVAQLAAQLQLDRAVLAVLVALLVLQALHLHLLVEVEAAYTE